MKLKFKPFAKPPYRLIIKFDCPHVIFHDLESLDEATKMLSDAMHYWEKTNMEIINYKYDIDLLSVNHNQVAFQIKKNGKIIFLNDNLTIQNKIFVE